MLGMYIHTHWGYHRPYAARSWTFADWEGYLASLQRLGYDTVMIWPQLASMAAQPTRSDLRWLNLLSRVIEVAHARYSMKVIIIESANTMGNEMATRYAFQFRPYFVCERKVDPRDSAEVAALMACRRQYFRVLQHADSLAIIDSDPGGFVGSTTDEFVELCRAQMDAFREWNPDAEFIYWMLNGWENYNRFWEKARVEGSADMWAGWRGGEFVRTLSLAGTEIPEPWRVLAWLPPHFEAIHSAGLTSKAIYFPYGVIEQEPTFPLTNCDPAALQERLTVGRPAGALQGTMANAQTHCLQLPHTFLFAQVAAGRTAAADSLASFADDVIPQLGRTVARGWLLLENGPPDLLREVARDIRGRAGRRRARGPLAGLLFGDADRFLIDLVMNLELRAGLADMQHAIDANQDVPAAVCRALDLVRPYQQRTGFSDAYGGPFHALLNDQLRRLRDDAIDAVLRMFTDWRDPRIRNGLALRLFEAVERSVNIPASARPRRSTRR